MWVLATVAVSGGIRLLLARRGRPAPPRGVRLSVAALAILLLVPATAHIQWLVRGHLAAGLDGGLETARDGHAARHLRHHADYLFREPIGAAPGRVLLAARLPHRRLLGDDGDPAAADHDLARARLAALPALFGAHAESSGAARAGVLAAVSTLRRAPLAPPGRPAQCGIGLERYHESRGYRSARPVG